MNATIAHLRDVNIELTTAIGNLEREAGKLTALEEDLRQRSAEVAEVKQQLKQQSEEYGAALSGISRQTKGSLETTNSQLMQQKDANMKPQESRSGAIAGLRQRFSIELTEANEAAEPKLGNTSSNIASADTLNATRPDEDPGFMTQARN